MSDAKKKQGSNAYRQNEVLTANPETVLLLLYAGAIRFLKQGIEALENKKLADKAKFIMRCHEICAELRAGLKLKEGGEVAVNLERLYEYVIDRLIQGNMKNEVKPLKEALDVLTTLNDAWEQAVAMIRKEKALAEK
jgi:flagellar protein FliS